MQPIDNSAVVAKEFLKQLSKADKKTTTEFQKYQFNSVPLKNYIPSNLAAVFARRMNRIIERPIRISITTIQLAIPKSSDQKQKLQELTKKINSSEKGSKIRLILSTFSEDEDAMLKLQTQFFKNFCPQITYLQWEISGNFSDAGQTQAIGEILKRFVHLYSLDLLIKNKNFADKDAVSLAAGLSKLKDLRVLKLNLNNFYDPLTRKGMQYIKTAISGMLELEILQQKLVSDAFPFPPKLAGLSFSLHWFLYGNRHSNTLQWIIDRKNITVEIILSGYDMDNNQEEKVLKETELTALRQLFTELLEFPYLTKFEQYLEKSIGEEIMKILQPRERIEILANERFKMILSIVVIDLVISELLPFNPQWLLVDMLFD